MAVQRPESETKIAAMFDRVAPRYDLLNRLLSAQQDQYWRRCLVRIVPYRPGGRYLDVATGTGDVLVAVARAGPNTVPISASTSRGRCWLWLAPKPAPGALTPNWRG